MKKALQLTCLLVTISFFAMSQGYITLYTDCDYRGTASKLYPGRYSLSNTSVKTNSVSSIRVPSGLKVVLYSSYNPGEGEKTRYTSDINCLPSNWNDRANSVLIELDNTGGNSGYNSNNGGYNTNNNNNNNYNNNNYDRNAVTIYADCNYGGRMLSISDGNYNDDNLGDVANDNISSIRIPKGYSVIAFSNKNWGGSSRTFTSDISCLSYDWNNKISSLRVVRGSSNGGYYENNYNVNEVTFYSDCNFSGKNRSLAPGVHTAAGLNPVGNDNISSIRIPSGYKVRVYMDNDRKGASREFTRDVSCLSSDWNDNISSIEISSRNGGYQSNYNDYGNNSGNYNYNSNNSNYNRSGNDNYGITMYKDSYLNGDRRSFGEGTYNLRDDDPLLANISSIRVEDGYVVEIYDDYDLRGKRLTVTHSALGLNIFGFNDKVRSFRVRRL